MLVDSVVKSGGNEFHGGATVYGANSHLEGNNVDDALRSQGMRGTPKLHHQCGTQRGPGRQDHPEQTLVFRRCQHEVVTTGRSWTRSIPTAHRSCLTTDHDYHVEKISYQMTPGNRFIGFYHQG